MHANGEGAESISWELQGHVAITPAQAAGHGVTVLPARTTLAHCLEACARDATCSTAVVATKACPHTASTGGTSPPPPCKHTCMLFTSPPPASAQLPPPTAATTRTALAQYLQPPTATLGTQFVKLVRAGAEVFVVVEGVPQAMIGHIPTCAYMLPKECGDTTKVSCPSGSCTAHLQLGLSGSAYATAVDKVASMADAAGFVVDGANEMFAVVPGSVREADGNIAVVPGPATTTPDIPQVARNTFWTYLRATRTSDGGYTVQVNGETVQVTTAPASTSAQAAHERIVVACILGVVLLATAIAGFVWWRRRRAQYARRQFQGAAAAGRYLLSRFDGGTPTTAPTQRVDGSTLL